MNFLFYFFEFSLATW